MIALSSCRNPSGNDGNRSGDVLIVLDGATGTDAAILLDIGPGTTAVTRAGSEIEIHSRARADGYLVAGFGPLETDTILRLSVKDVTEPPTVTIRDIAQDDGSLRRDLSEYSLRVVR